MPEIEFPVTRDSYKERWRTMANRRQDPDLVERCKEAAQRKATARFARAKDARSKATPGLGPSRWSMLKPANALAASHTRDSTPTGMYVTAWPRRREARREAGSECKCDSGSGAAINSIWMMGDGGVLEARNPDVSLVWHRALVLAVAALRSFHHRRCS